MSEDRASRFKHHSNPSIPFTDLIRVDEATFATMMESAQDSPLPLVVSMLGFRSLLAMKLFALKDGESRDHKDLLDIRTLLRYSPTKIDEEELWAMCKRYAGPGAFELIKSRP